MMFNSIRNNSGYITTLALWSIVGMFSVEASIPVILINLILFFRKERYYEALFGMFFLFILSDNLEELWLFAKVVKPYYLLLFGILIILDYEKLVKWPLLVKRFTIFLLIAFACLLFSDSPFIGLQKVISYALILLVVPNIVLFEYRKMGKEFFSNIVAFSIIIHLISISVMLAFPEVGTSHNNRWQGVFGNPNGLGLYMIVTYTLYKIILYEFPGIFTKRENIFYVLISILFVWMSGSRTALLSILTFEFIVFGFYYSKGLTLLLVVTFLIYFDIIYIWLISGLYELGLSDSLRLDSLEEGSGRLIAWQFAWQDIKQNTLILGKGMGYDEQLMRANFNSLSRLGHEGGVHNTYLIIWLNTGIIGLLAFLSGLFSLLYEGMKRVNYAIPLFFAVLISANFEPWLSASLNPYTCVFLISITLMLKIDENEKMATSNRLGHS